jgi:2-alkenal reductase
MLASLEALQAEQQAFAMIYDVTIPSVVQIGVLAAAPQQPSDPFGGIPGLPFEFEQPPERQRQGQGSGFVYSNDGYIVTNNHVIADAEEIQVRFNDGTVLPAEVVGTDPFADLAVIQVDELPDNAGPLPVFAGEELQVGQIVVALGSPFGLASTMTTGIISGLGRELPTPTSEFTLQGVIQTDAAINPGNSGGPLLDLEGRVIGVNTAITSPSGAFAGVGFAVPYSRVSQVVPALIEEGRYNYPWLGVQVLNVTPALAEEFGLAVEEGALVTDVVADSPADDAGIRGGGTVRQFQGIELRVGGDIITAIEGEPVASSADLINQLLNYEVGETIALMVVRDGEEEQVSVTLAERPMRQ